MDRFAGQLIINDTSSVGHVEAWSEGGVGRGAVEDSRGFRYRPWQRAVPIQKLREAGSNYNRLKALMA
jgi:hypothetical protein